MTEALNYKRNETKNETKKKKLLCFITPFTKSKLLPIFDPVWRCERMPIKVAHSGWRNCLRRWGSATKRPRNYDTNTKCNNQVRKYCFENEWRRNLSSLIAAEYNFHFQFPFYCWFFPFWHFLFPYFFHYIFFGEIAFYWADHCKQYFRLNILT